MTAGLKLGSQGGGGGKFLHRYTGKNVLKSYFQELQSLNKYASILRNERFLITFKIVSLELILGAQEGFSV